MTTTTNTLGGLTLDQLKTRRDLNRGRGIQTSQALLDEIKRREFTESLHRPRPVRTFQECQEDLNTALTLGVAQTYIVMCRVSGGVTGTHEAPLKKAGQVQYFTDRAEAETVAANLNRPRPFATAHFCYWVLEA